MLLPLFAAASSCACAWCTGAANDMMSNAVAPSRRLRRADGPEYPCSMHSVSTDRYRSTQVVLQSLGDAPQRARIYLFKAIQTTSLSVFPVFPDSCPALRSMAGI